MKRILVYHNASLGDIIVALPALKLIRKAFEGCSIFLLTVKHQNIKATQPEKILANTNLIDGYILLQANHKKLSQILELRTEIQKYNPEILIYLNEPRDLLRLARDYLMFKLFGIKKIIGIQFQKLNRSIQNQGNNNYENISHFLGRKISDLGLIDFSDPTNFDIHLTSSEISKAKETLSQLKTHRPIIGMSVGTKFASNHWGYDRWENFLHLLSKKYPNHNLVAIGSADEFDRTALLLKKWVDRSLNLCGALSIRESAGVLSQCSIFIGHDSGPIHLASSVQVPCVGIYGSRNLPGIWFPSGKNDEILYTAIDCQGCQLSICSEKNNKCIRSISPDDVILATEKILAHLQ